jgi:hypothetical protein
VAQQVVQVQQCLHQQLKTNLVNKHMNLLEMFKDEMPGYRTEKDDSTALKLSDVRKTKVTLKQLNRLRIMNDVRRLEHEQDLEKVKAQYKAPVETSEPM